MTHAFTYWQNALQGTFGPIHENDPQPGYYRTKPGRKERSMPVAIWKDDDGIHALRDGLPVDPSAVWTWCCQHPVAYQTYLAAAEHGEPWPDEIPAVGIGHNSDGSFEAELSPAERLKVAVDGLRREAENWLSSIGSVCAQAEADKAANFADAFSQFEKEAEDARTAEKKPVLEQGRAIDARWKPVIAAADEAKRSMKRALEPFLIAEAKRLSEVGGFGPISETARAGTNGRRIALRRTKRVSVTDRNAFIAHYRRDARLFEDEAVQKVLLRLAETDLAAGKRVAGAEFVEEQVAA